MTCPILQPPATPAQHGTRSVAVANSAGRPGFIILKGARRLGKFTRGDFQQTPAVGRRPVWRGRDNGTWRLVATG